MQDTRVREQHSAIDGQRVKGSNGLFSVRTRDGAEYRVDAPGHYSLPPELRCHCRCTILTETEQPGAEQAATTDAAVVDIEPPHRTLLEEARGLKNQTDIEQFWREKLNANIGYRKLLTRGRLSGWERKKILAATEEAAALHDRFPAIRHGPQMRFEGVNSKTLEKITKERVAAMGQYNSSLRRMEVAFDYPTASGAPNFGGYAVDQTVPGVTRHEYAHRAFRHSIDKKALAEWERLVAEINVTEKISLYGATNTEEAFAEAFTAYASPQYRAGSLPRAIEVFFKRVMGG